MSRNVDKANTVLFRYQEQMAERNGYIDYNSTQRPRSVNKVTHLKDAEQWRKQVIQEISQKMLKIADERTSDYQIRDLNDELNKLMREKLAWEHHIKSLGGPDYIRSDQGRIGGGVMIRGYRYFGRAKELPGVKQILAQQEEDQNDAKVKKQQTKTQKQRFKELEERVGIDYYGYTEETPDFTGDVKRQVYAQVQDLLGDSVDLGLEEDEIPQSSRRVKDELLKFERSATRKRTKKLLQEKKEPTGEVLLISDASPVTLNQVEAFLVERRKRQLEQQLDM